jgi:hypothetical protein
MGLVNNSQETHPYTPFLLFPSRARIYVRLTAQQAYESVNNLLGEISGSKILESSRKETLMTKARLDGGSGATVTIRVFPEGDVSALDLAFSYREAMYAVVAAIITILGLGWLFFQSTFIPLGFLLLIFLITYTRVIYIANNSALRFLDLVNKTLPFIEKEFAHKALMADRERWEAQPKKTEALYRRLSEKHIKTWGNTKVLEYKIKEYQTLGLTRNEAIRKVAEEEGVN